MRFNLWGEEGWRSNPVPSLAYSYWSSPKNPPDLTSSSNGRITTNSAYAFTTYPLQRDFGFYPGIFGVEISDWGFAPQSLQYFSCCQDFYPTGDGTRHSFLIASEIIFIVQRSLKLSLNILSCKKKKQHWGLIFPRYDQELEGRNVLLEEICIIWNHGFLEVISAYPLNYKTLKAIIHCSCVVPKYCDMIKGTAQTFSF